MHEAFALRKRAQRFKPCIIFSFGVEIRRCAHVDQGIDDLQVRFQIKPVILLMAHETVHSLMQREKYTLDRHRVL